MIKPKRAARIGMGVTIDASLHTRLDALAEAHDLTRSELVNQLLELGIKSLEPVTRAYSEEEAKAFAQHPEWCDNDDQRAAGIRYRTAHPEEFTRGV